MVPLLSCHQNGDKNIKYPHPPPPLPPSLWKYSAPYSTCLSLCVFVNEAQTAAKIKPQLRNVREKPISIYWKWEQHSVCGEGGYVTGMLPQTPPDLWPSGWARWRWRPVCHATCHTTQVSGLCTAVAEGTERALIDHQGYFLVSFLRYKQKMQEKHKIKKNNTIQNKMASTGKSLP